MGEWYSTRDRRDNSEITISLDNVNAIANYQGYAAFIMNNPITPNINTVFSNEKYDDVIRKLFGPEEGEDNGEPRDPSGFDGILPM